VLNEASCATRLASAVLRPMSSKSDLGGVESAKGLQAQKLEMADYGERSAKPNLLQREVLRPY
jgi:hypothetical protein